MTRSPGAPRRPLWPFVVAALAVVGFLVGGGIEHARHRRVAMPGPPVGLHAFTSTCSPPRCATIRSQVMLTWEPGAGAAATSLAVQRDGVTIPGQGGLPPATVRFVDESVTAGDRHTYAIVAANTAGTARSAAVVALVPLPPLTAARLDGAYHVTLVVRRAVNLATLQGIVHPARGSRSRSVWVFVDPCPPNSTSCDARWRGHAGGVAGAGTVWSGVVTGRRAACFGGVRARAPIRLRLVARAGEMAGGVWVVSHFEGWSSVRFQCPGFRPSHGTVAVDGLR